jgi:hypothetical protein
MAGKDKIERGFRVIWDDGGGTPRDLSAALLPGTVNGGGLTLDEVDMTGVSDAVKKFLGGHADSPINGQFHMDDTATTGAFTVLSVTTGSIGTLTLQWGSNGAAPTTGDPEWEGEYVLMGIPVTNNGGKMVLDASWQPAAGQPDPAWGTV